MDRRLLALAAVLTLSFVACGGGGGSSSLSAVPNTNGTGPNFAQYTGPAALANFTWNKNLVTKMQYLGPAGDGMMEVHVGVTMQNAAGLAAYAQQVSDPSSPLYRHFLTPQEIGDRFGASQSDYANAANYFASFGMKVGGWPQREMLAVSGSYQQFGAAFGTTFGKYRMGNLVGIAPMSTPHLVRVAPIASVEGLANVQLLHSDMVRVTNSFFTGYSPQQIANGLDFTGAYSAGFTGTGITVGIIGTGPIDPNDATKFSTLYNASMASITQVAAQPQAASTTNNNTGTGATDPNPSGLQPAPPVTAPCTSVLPACNPEDGEAQLDTQSVASLAPGANVLFYLAYNPLDCVDSGGNVVKCKAGVTPTKVIGIQILDDELQQAIADNRADILSISVGGPEDLQGQYGAPGGLGDLEYQSLATEGIATFISSGDDGAWETQNATGTYTGSPTVSYPASDPFVVGVGGVNLPLDVAGKLTNAITTWGDTTTGGGSGTFQKNDVGSGGGISLAFTPPTYQSAAIPGITQREVPDMAMDADPLTGPAILENSSFGSNAQLGSAGGTSAAAPEAAAAWALVLQACKAQTSCATGPAPTSYRLGNPDPILYSIYHCTGVCAPLTPGATFTSQLPYSSAIYDVIYGNNTAVPAAPTPTPSAVLAGYAAATGYDMVTGIGVPFVGHLIQAVTGTTVP
ncbi:MAG: S53 family peptidase [Vulcanimicrobiaceae bacterium]